MLALALNSEREKCSCWNNLTSLNLFLTLIASVLMVLVKVKVHQHLQNLVFLLLSSRVNNNLAGCRSASCCLPLFLPWDSCLASLTVVSSRAASEPQLMSTPGSLKKKKKIPYQEEGRSTLETSTKAERNLEQVALPPDPFVPSVFGPELKQLLLVLPVKFRLKCHQTHFKLKSN